MHFIVNNGLVKLTGLWLTFTHGIFRYIWRSYMRFWWLSDCNCSAPLRARACCGVRTERARSGLATSIGIEFGCSQTKKSISKVAKQHECARSRVIEKFKRASFDAKFDAAEWQRAADKKG